MAGKATGAAPGVVGMAGVGLSLDTGTGPNAVSPSTWTYIIFGVAVAYLVMIYFGLGGFRGAVAS